MHSMKSIMRDIGKLIEARRRRLGLSRLQLAKRLGVSSQTILNLERDQDYNLGTSLLRRLEVALHVTFELTMKEVSVSKSIQMGNDEFILYVRKNHPSCTTDNRQLGKRIWMWIQDQDSAATKVDGDEAVPCYWGETGDHIGETMLPYKATQFRFERTLLPSLYTFLDDLGSE